MKTQALFALFVLAPVLVSGAFARSTQNNGSNPPGGPAPNGQNAPPTGDDSQHSFPWPVALERPDLASRVESGDVTGDLSVDAVVVLDGVPWMLFGAAAFSTPVKLPIEGVNDFELTPRPDLRNTQMIVTISATGLDLWTWDRTTHVWNGFNVENAHIDAIEVRAGDLDGDGDEDLVVLEVDGKTTTRYRNLGDEVPYFELWEVGAFPEVASQFELLDWDADGELEIAYMADPGPRVVEQDGTLLSSYTPVQGGGRMTVLESAFTPGDRLAWFLPNLFSTGFNWLWVADKAGIETFVELGTYRVSGIASADYDFDGDEELVLSSIDTQEVRIYLNQESDPNASATYIEDPAYRIDLELPSGPSMAFDRVAQPGFADFDDDGDPDLFMIDELNQSFWIRRGQHIDESRLRHRVRSLSFYNDAQTGQGVIQFAIWPSLDVPVGVTGMELSLWEVDTVDEDTDPVPIYSTSIPTDGTQPVFIYAPIGEQGNEFDKAYPVMIRLLGATSMGEEFALTPLTGVITAQAVDLSFLEQQWSFGVTITFIPGGIALPTLVIPKRVLVGGMIPGPPVPVYVEGTIQPGGVLGG